MHIIYRIFLLLFLDFLRVQVNTTHIYKDFLWLPHLFSIFLLFFKTNILSSFKKKKNKYFIYTIYKEITPFGTFALDFSFQKYP